MNNKLLYLPISMAIIFLLLLTYSFLNGSSCRYSISIYVKDDDRNVFMTCYRGKIVALQTSQDKEGNLLSKWKVEARHLRLGNQVIYFVYSRTPVIEDHKVDSNDRFNEISSGYKFLFYNMKRQGNKVYIFQTFPRYFVHEGQIDGVLDVWDD